MPSGIYLPPIIAPVQLPVAGLIPWATGRFYSSPCRAAGLATASLNGFKTCPIFVPNINGVTVTSVGVEVTTFASTSSRFGIYDIDERGRPGKLILDVGQISFATSNGFKSIGSLSQFLLPGWYWIVSVNDGTGGASSRSMDRDFPFFGTIDEQDASGAPLSTWDRNGGGTNTQIAMYNDGMPKSLSALLKANTTSYPRFMVGI